LTGALIKILFPEQAISTVAQAADEDVRACAVKLYEKVKMTTGTVKWFNTQKGFGFIAPDDGGNDAFVHISAVERAGLSDLREGQKVGYELVADRKSGKTSAGNLQLLT
jgi:CspA family cold shock protein